MPGGPSLSAVAAAEQATFRALLSAMARPGTVVHLAHRRPEDGAWASALVVLQSLLDHEVTFSVLTADGYPREQLLRRTGSRITEVETADFILAAGDAAEEAIRRAKDGDLEYPDASATVVLSCDTVGGGPLRLLLAGPGVNGTATLAVGGVGAAAFENLRERNVAFPLGVDVILAGQDGNAACIPRSTRIDDIGMSTEH